jgi:hypothetical protein
VPEKPLAYGAKVSKNLIEPLSSTAIEIHGLGDADNGGDQDDD